MDETSNEFVQLYTDLKGNLRLLLNKEPQMKPKIQIDDGPMRRKRRQSSAESLYRHAFIKTGRLLLVHRESGNQVPVPIDWVYQNETSAKKFGLYRYHYTATIHWSQLYKQRNYKKGFMTPSSHSTSITGRNQNYTVSVVPRYITRQLTPEALGR